MKSANFSTFNVSRQSAIGAIGRGIALTGLAVVFSGFFIYYSRNTAHSFWVYWAPSS